MDILVCLSTESLRLVINYSSYPSSAKIKGEVIEGITYLICLKINKACRSCDN